MIIKTEILCQFVGRDGSSASKRWQSECLWQRLASEGVGLTVVEAGLQTCVARCILKASVVCHRIQSSLLCFHFVLLHKVSEQVPCQIPLVTRSCGGWIMSDMFGGLNLLFLCLCFLKPGRGRRVLCIPVGSPDIPSLLSLPFQNGTSNQLLSNSRYLPFFLRDMSIA